MRGSAAPGPWIHPWICPWPINSYTSLFRGKKYAHFNSTVLLHTYSLQPFLQHVSHKCTYPTNTYPVIPTITCGKPNDVKCWLSTVRNQHFCKQYMGQVLYWVLFVTNELQKHWELFKLSRTSNVHDQYLHAPVIKAIYLWPVKSICETMHVDNFTLYTIYMYILYTRIAGYFHDWKFREMLCKVVRINLVCSWMK